jgi:hypothetical protein
MSVFTHQLKDERRPLEKIQAVKTRLFTMSPMEFTIMMRIFFIDYIAAYFDAHSKFHSQIGIDVEGPEWTALYNRLVKLSKVGFDGDHSECDGNRDPLLTMDVFETADLWYRRILGKSTFSIWFDDDLSLTLTADECSYVRRMIAYETVHTYQIVRDCIHQKNHGNPSGNIFTTIINSDTNELELRMSYMETAQIRALDFGMIDEHLNDTRPESFDQNVAAATFGDDVICAVTPRASLLLNALTHSDFMRARKRVFTPANKQAENSEQLVSLEELSFLKRSFVSHPTFPQYKLAPINTRSITELVQWIRRCPDESAALQTNILTAARFSYHHGRKFYEDFRSKVNDALLTRKIEIPLLPDLYNVEDVIWLGKLFTGKSYIHNWTYDVCRRLLQE